MIKILPTFKDLQITMHDEDSIQLEETLKSWIKHLESQKGISISNPNFDFDNQLDDFIDGDGEYYNVIQFIKYFFNMRKSL